MLLVKDIDVYYGGVQVLRGLSLKVGDGEIVAVLGANGAGKSTLLRTISGLLRPRRGEICYNGREIGGLAPEKIVRMGVVHVPEGRKIFRGLTVLQNLRLVTSALGVPKDEEMRRLREVFALFPKLKERQAQLGWSLSGGEQQMLAIGRGLMANPSLLMLDEPSLGLAPGLVEQVFDAIVRIKRTLEKSVLLVEQNAAAALSIADRGYVIELGECSLEGRAADLLGNAEVKRRYLAI